MTSKESGKVHKPPFGKVMEKLMHDLTITDGAVRLYAHMYWRYGENKDNHEGQAKMAKLLGVGEKTIRNRIDELEANDWVITVYQEPDEKGNWQRCYYHVFETQAECIKFRAEFKPAEGEKIEPKPAGRVRKSRKGKGNPEPKVPNRKNSGSDGIRQKPSSTGGQNSGSDGRWNSGSDNLDSGYLDSSIESGRILQIPKHMVGFEKQNNNRTHAWVKAYAEMLGKPYGANTAEMKALLEVQQAFTIEQFKLCVAEKLRQKPGAKLLFVLEDMPNILAALEAPKPEYRTMSPAAPTPADHVALKGEALEAQLRAVAEKHGLPYTPPVTEQQESA
jgi:hypothetical protein